MMHYIVTSGHINEQQGLLVEIYEAEFSLVDEPTEQLMMYRLKLWPAGMDLHTV